MFFCGANNYVLTTSDLLLSSERRKKPRPHYRRRQAHQLPERALAALTIIQHDLEQQLPGIFSGFDVRLGVRGSRLEVDVMVELGMRGTRPIDRDVLMLPEITVEDLSASRP